MSKCNGTGQKDFLCKCIDCALNVRRGKFGNSELLFKPSRMSHF